MSIDISRFVQVTLIEDGARYRVAAGDKREGMRGTAVAIIGLKHTPSYEVILHLDNGKQDSFSPFQLFPEAAQ